MVPIRLRRPRFLAFATALVRPLESVRQSLLRFKAAKEYHLTITPQVCYLERLLNTRYDRRDRRIFIADGIDRPPLYIYARAENKSVFIYTRGEDQPVAVYTRGESTYLLDDFIIWVPDSLDFDESEMTSLVKVYKLAGTKFKIQRY